MAAHNPGLLVIVVRMLEKLAARPELAEHPRVQAEVLKELGSAYAELPVADRQRAVQAGVARLLQAQALIPEGVDPAFSAGILHDLGNAHGFALALQGLRPRGTLVLKSTYAGSLTLDVAPIVVNELTLVGSRCGPFAPALQLLAAGRVQVEPLVHARYALADGVAAFTHAAQPGTLKVLLDMGAEGKG